MGSLIPHIERFQDSDFRVSSFTEDPMTCVAVAIGERAVAVRSTLDPKKRTVYFNHAEWYKFCKGMKNNEFELSAAAVKKVEEELTARSVATDTKPSVVNAVA